MADAQTINIPQLLVLALITLLIIRWFFSSPASPAPGAQNAATAHGSRVNPAHVDQILSIFPQLDRRTVIWELQRNGGNMARITEVVLAGGRLSVVSVAFGLRISKREGLASEDKAR
jgi:coupling of ubiquitin conjugation to ER degradation protein 1